jgi:DNA-binding LacI/PurR family transcriptional regulator
VPLVAIDDADGGAAVVRHLHALGHRRLAVVTMPLQADGHSGPADVARQQGAAYRVMRDRLGGAAAAAGEAGLAWADVPVIECPANDPELAARAAAGLLAAADRPTAVIALSDRLALGVLRAASAAGLPVPERLSVTGFDDSPAAAAAEPPLTTVGQPLRERGETAGRLVRTLLRGEAVAAPPRAPVRLVVRASTGPAPAIP